MHRTSRGGCSGYVRMHFDEQDTSRVDPMRQCYLPETVVTHQGSSVTPRPLLLVRQYSPASISLSSCRQLTQAIFAISGVVVLDLLVLGLFSLGLLAALALGCDLL